MAISRHGINRGDSGPLLSASFEETVEVLFKSAIFARKDDVDGVTPNIMLGQLAHVGTGVSDLLLDSAQLEHAVELEAPDQQQNASLRVVCFIGFTSTLEYFIPLEPSSAFTLKQNGHVS